MRINQHIAQGFFLSLILMMTFGFISIRHSTPDTQLFYLILIFSTYFILLGSIYPDVDERGAWKIKIAGIFSFVFSLFKIFLAYPLRWMVYYPSFWTIKKFLPQKYNYLIEDKHHNTSHTFLGIGIASLYLFILVNFLFFLIGKHSYTINTFYNGLLFSTSMFIGFLVGCLIHFVQDAYSGRGNSAYGISPFKPFKNTTFYGNYSSYCDDPNDKHLRKQGIIMSLLLFIFVLIIPWGTNYIFNVIENILIGTIIMSLFILSTLMIIFSAFGIKFRMKIKKDHYEKPLQKQLIITIVTVVLIDLIIYIFYL